MSQQKDWSVEFAALMKRERLLNARRALGALSSEQRLELFARYCPGCGRPDPTCQCWNDE